MPMANTITSTTERIERIALGYPSLSGDEAGLICDIADDIQRYAQRHRRELAAVLATEPATAGPPIDRPAWRDGSKSKVVDIYDYMLANDDQWMTIKGVADALGLHYEKIKYSFSQMKSRGYIVRGLDLKRPNGGPGTHQYRLARKEQSDPEKEIAA